MAGVADDGRGHGSPNPFPSLAVAHVWDRLPGRLTIKTQAVREVDRFVGEYLRAARPAANSPAGRSLAGTGRACAIEGEYGTGKTHLAGELLDRVEAARAGGGVDTRAFYRTVPDDGSLLTLYVDLMKHEITRDEVLAGVREMYADIVAVALRDRPYTHDLAGRLERGDVDPQRVIDRYGMKEGALREELGSRLAAVTRDETFSRALMLLLQPELRLLAWDWLVGGKPGNVLAERGVASPIQTDERALEAIGVIARLYGDRNCRFVLVIDDMEKLAFARGSEAAASVQGLRKLLEAFQAAGALLVVCGLPDVFDVLPDRSRFDAIVRPSLLSAADVRWYITETRRRAFGGPGITPFSQESIDSIVAITGGVARDVQRFCYFAYAEAEEYGHEIMPEHIRLIARQQVPVNDAERVRDHITDLLHEQGWLVDRHRVLGPVAEATADFWIPMGEHGGGCAVLVSDSVLEDQQAQRVVGQASAIMSAGQDRVVIVVIAGYLAPSQRPALAGEPAAGPLIVYNARTFSKEFTAAVAAVSDRIVGGTPGLRRNGSVEDELHLLREELNRVVRQQANTMHAVAELATRTVDQLAALQRSVAAIPAQGGAAERAAELPDELAALFSAARRSLHGYGDPRQFVDATMRASAVPGELFPRTQLMRGQDAFVGIGISAFLSSLLDGFEDGVRAWLGALGKDRAEGTEPADDARVRLHGICQAYDALYYATPAHRLDVLPGTAAGQPDDAVPAVPSRSARRAEFKQAFEGLGDRVYQAALAAVGTARRPGHGS